MTYPRFWRLKVMPILFADDASVLISHSNPIKFKNTVNEVYGLLDDWFKKNSNVFKYKKTYYINFTAKYKVESEIGDLGYILIFFSLLLLLLM
jgi:hypothetical protein